MKKKIIYSSITILFLGIIIGFWCYITQLKRNFNNYINGNECPKCEEKTCEIYYPILSIETNYNSKINEYILMSNGEVYNHDNIIYTYTLEEMNNIQESIKNIDFKSKNISYIDYHLYDYIKDYIENVSINIYNEDGKTQIIKDGTGIKLSDDNKLYEILKNVLYIINPNVKDKYAKFEFIDVTNSYKNDNTENDIHDYYYLYKTGELKFGDEIIYKIDNNDINIIEKNIDLLTEDLSCFVSDDAITQGIDVIFYKTDGTPIIIKEFYCHNSSDAATNIDDIVDKINEVIEARYN